MRVVKSLYVQVLIGIGLGILVGILWPKTGEALKPLGDGFIKLIKVVIAPIVFCTVAGGIAHMGDLKRVGRVGIKALIYFEVVSTFALAIGLLVATVFHPGAGFNANPATLDTTAVAGYVQKAHDQTLAGTLLGFIPDSFVGAFTGGDLIQVLLLAVLTGLALPHLGERGQGATKLMGEASALFFSILRIIVRAAPIGAFGAMAFTVGKFGASSLVRLGALVGTFYATSALFVLLVLGLVARLTGFSILKFLAYIKEELFLVLGTSSSETVLPQLMGKLERLGVSRPVVGLVVPAGYSFNLDGTNIYMTLATLFLAQATNIHLSAAQLATLLLVAMLTSKGATGVTGSGFVTLAATLAAVPNIPVTALALIIGVDRFMSECRALTNVIGNGVATVAVGKWEGELDMERMRAELSKGVSATPRE